MFSGGYQIPCSVPKKPLPIPNYANVIEGFQAYSADNIGPFSSKVSKEIFRNGHQEETKTNNNKQISNHTEKISGRNLSKYTPASLEREINARVVLKLREHAENLEKRHKKLKELLAKEEREEIQEIINLTNQEKQNYVQGMKIRIQELRAKRETERLAVVKAKKLQQYIENCEEIRPVLEMRRLKDTKEAQKAQMLEKEQIKQNEKEVNRTWNEILAKDVEAKKEKEHRVNIATRRRNLEDKCFWDLQCKERELAKLDKIREKKEDAINLENIKEEIRRDEIAQLDAKRRKRDEFYMDIMSQIKQRQEMLAKQTLEDKLYYETRNKLLDKETISESSSQLKKRLREEVQYYNDYIQRLNQERKDEEKRLDELIAQELKDIQQKQDEARQKYQKARKVLQKAVQEGRKLQTQYKKEEAEQQLKLKQVENQMLQMAQDQNERSRADFERQKILSTAQYREDLHEQIEQSKAAKELEKEQIEIQLCQGRIQEEECKRNLINILNSDVKLSDIHPFRKVLNKKRIPCPKNLYY